MGQCSVCNRVEPSELIDGAVCASQACALTALARLYTALEFCATYEARLDDVELGDTEIDRMADIAWQAADVRADTMQALAAKAEIFERICQDLESDVAVKLGASLCKDVRRLEKRVRSDNH